MRFHWWSRWPYKDRTHICNLELLQNYWRGFDGVRLTWAPPPAPSPHHRSPLPANHGNCSADRSKAVHLLQFFIVCLSVVVVIVLLCLVVVCYPYLFLSVRRGGLLCNCCLSSIISLIFLRVVFLCGGSESNKRARVSLLKQLQTASKDAWNAVNSR